MKKSILLFLINAFLFGALVAQQKNNTKLLPSWNEGKAKNAIIDFVNKTTQKGSADYIPLSDRIACFDNDGTLWSEQPLYFQFFFAIDRIKAMAPQHPEWKTKEPFKSILEGNLKAALAGGEHSIVEIVMATHSGMSTTEFDKIVADWIATAKHPSTGLRFVDMVYQPMLELLNYLRANGYKTFIVSGGGIDFLRVWAEKVYNIPPYQVIGSSAKVKYEGITDNPILVKLPELNFIDDKSGKPVGIHQHIGKIPVFSGGNSDGDYEMLQYTSTRSTPHFGMIVRHTDPQREFAYDRNSSIGKLDKGLNDAAKYNWLIVDMQKDWKIIFPEKKK
jgi:phosphoglycolate phosphatase-like HAD superfamily hydrolase